MKSSPAKPAAPANLWDGQQRFIGHVQDGVPHGSGMENSEDEGTYCGFYSWGRRHGVGKLTRATGTYFKEYLGDWKDGARTGYGFEKTKGSSYFGTFVQGRREGLGECVYDDGSEYIGQVMAGQKHGFGKLKTVGGEIYIGNWRHDRQDGVGFYNQSNPPVKYFGVWRAGEFLPDKGVDLSVQMQDTRDLEMTRANEEENSFLMNSTFFEEATSKIIEIDQKLTASKSRIKKEFLSVITDYSQDILLLDRSAKEVDSQVRGALKEFSMLWAALVRASQNAGFDVDAACRLVSDMEARGFAPGKWINEPQRISKADSSEENYAPRPFGFADRSQRVPNDNKANGLTPPANSNPMGQISSLNNNDPLRDIFSIEKEGTSVTDSDRNTLGKMGGSLLKSKPGQIVSDFQGKGNFNDQGSQIDTPRSQNSQDDPDIPL